MTDNIDFNKIIETVKSTKSIVLDKNLRSQVAMKGEADFVTEVDFRISKYMEKELAVLTPGIGFMSEEEKNEIVPTRWILDPIDGTTNLVYEYNMCSVSLALCVDEVIEFGVVYNPFNDDLFVAHKGKGAVFNGEKMPQVTDRDLCDCLVEFGAGSTRKDEADIAFDIGREVFKNCLDIRRICSSALSICYVAAGRLNGYFEKKIKPWDYAAAGLILSECGGCFTDWKGNAIQYRTPSGVICGSPKMHEFLLDTINKFDNKDQCSGDWMNKKKKLFVMDDIGVTNKYYRNIAHVSVGIVLAILQVYLILVLSGMDLFNFTFIENELSRGALQVVVQLLIFTVLYALVYNLTALIYSAYWKNKNRKIWVKGDWLHIHIKDLTHEIRVGTVAIEQNFYSISGLGRNTTPGDTDTHQTEWSYTFGRVEENNTNFLACYSAEKNGSSKNGLHSLRFSAFSDGYPVEMHGRFADTVGTPDNTEPIKNGEDGELFFFRITDTIKKQILSDSKKNKYDYSKIAELYTDPECRKEEFVRTLRRYIGYDKTDQTS